MIIRASVLETVEQHATAAAPDECCGLLLGTADQVAVAVPARNAAREPTRRYLIDPVDHFAAIRRARMLDLAVVGAYHSHPASPPVPSATDRAEAFEHFLFLIAGRSGIRAWRLDAGNFVEVPFVRVA